PERGGERRGPEQKAAGGAAMSRLGSKRGPGGHPPGGGRGAEGREGESGGGGGGGGGGGPRPGDRGAGGEAGPARGGRRADGRSRSPRAYGRSSCEYRTWKGANASSSAARRPAAVPARRRRRSVTDAIVATPQTTSGIFRCQSAGLHRSTNLTTR